MILQFRTKRNANGNCKYLAIDTDAETFATSPRGWISKDIPEIKSKDMDAIREQAEQNGYRRILFM